MADSLGPSAVELVGGRVQDGHRSSSMVNQGVAYRAQQEAGEAATAASADHGQAGEPGRLDEAVLGVHTGHGADLDLKVRVLLANQLQRVVDKLLRLVHSGDGRIGLLLGIPRVLQAQRLLQVHVGDIERHLHDRPVPVRGHLAGD